MGNSDADIPSVRGARGEYLNVLCRERAMSRISEEVDTVGGCER